MLDTDKRVLGFPGPDEFVQLHLNGGAVPVLGVLDEEDHHERNNRRTGIYDELPGVREIKERTGDRPNENDGAGDDESRSTPRSKRGPARYSDK